jgi:hypothetical protein
MSWDWCWASRSFSPRLCCPEKSSSSDDPNYRKKCVVYYSVADPGSWTGKNQDPDQGSGSGMKIRIIYPRTWKQFF